MPAGWDVPARSPVLAAGWADIAADGTAEEEGAPLTVTPAAPAPVSGSGGGASA